MQDIKPDTSLYTDLPNKMRALAEVIERKAEIQWHCRRKNWEKVTSSVGDMMMGLTCGQDYRSKPKPRELWASFNEHGALYAMHEFSVAPAPGCTVVRFVEQPE